MGAIADARMNGTIFFGFGYWCRDSLRGMPPILKALDEFAKHRSASRKSALGIKPVCISNNYNRALP